MLPLSHLQIGIIFFRPKPPGYCAFFFFHFSLFNDDDICRAFNSTLLNGKGRYPGGPSNVTLVTLNVHQGKRSVLSLATSLANPLNSRLLMHCCYHSYRFRLVSISCEPNFVFSVDGHSMTVTEVDGNNV